MGAGRVCRALLAERVRPRAARSAEEERYANFPPVLEYGGTAAAALGLSLSALAAALRNPAGPTVVWLEGSTRFAHSKWSAAHVR